MLVAPAKPRLAFISPVFLFPNDAGGKIRTTNILRGLKGGAFEITLVSVASEEQRQRWAPEISSVCDQFIPWTPVAPKPKWRRAFDLLRALPVNVIADKTPQGTAAAQQAAESLGVDVVVFDFVHSAVLWPKNLTCASVCFTHNVEAEIFARHAHKANNPFRRWMWSSQYKKMARFERQALGRFTTVIAVSERDAGFFAKTYAIEDSQAIPTGVDLDFFSWVEPPPIDEATPATVVFTGSMDWAANIDGVQFFLREVWPLVLCDVPTARFVVVGRHPPAALVAMAQQTKNVQFTGFVDDVRPYVHAAHVFVIPLLVGGGTRIKAFEAMAMGCPIVSTSLGTEGLGAQPDAHFLERDGAPAMAQAVLTLLKDSTLRNQLSSRARQLVEQKFGHQVAANAFEKICLHAVRRHANDSMPPLPPVRTLLFSTLYPSSVRPGHGIFVETRLRELLGSGQVQTKVVAPVPWFFSTDPRYGDYARMASTPARETRNGVDVVHPRYFLPPKIGMNLAPALLALGARPAVQRLLDEGFDFDVIDAHYYYPDGVAAALLARHFKKPFTVTARGTDLNLIPQYTLPRRMMQWAASRAAASIGVCSALVDVLRAWNISEDRLRVMRNGVDLVRFRPVSQNAARSELGLTGSPLMISVGYLIERKGHHIAIEALAKILPIHSQARLIIVGEGEERKRLESLCQNLGVQDHVTFTGALPNAELYKWYSAADLMILASSREGWANVLLESMACGTPVVAARIWGTPEVVAEDVAGRLVDQRNGGAFADAICALLASYPDRAMVRAYAERFSWQSTTDAQIALFRQVSGAGRTAEHA